MEYDFIHDATTGEAKARFSLEHEVIGPWLEVEVGHNSEKLMELLTAIDTIEHGKQREIMIVGSEYSVAISREDVEIQSNRSFDGEEILPESLTDEHIDFDQNDCAACGIEDFRTLLLSWAKFIQH